MGYNILCGCISYFLVSTIIHPMDLIRVRVAVDLNNMTNEKIYKGFYDGIKKIINNEGFTGIYKGYALHLVSHLPFYGIGLGLYRYSKQN